MTVPSIIVPDFLRPASPPPGAHRYGKLTFDKDYFFILTGESLLLEFAKRLFPGAKLIGRKSIQFRTSRREVSDLNWLLQRFPVEIQCDEFEEHRQEVVKQFNQRIAGDDHKRTTPPVEFVGKLYPYQEEAVSFLTINKRTLLADGMGLGKTWSSLGATATAGKYPVLIVCQTQVQKQWQRVIGALFNLPCKGQPGLFDSPFDTAVKRGQALAPILKGQTPYDIPDTPFTIIHYGLLSWWDNKLHDRGYPVVIYDEIQELRHTGSQKYSAASLRSSDAEYVWGLSGTPIFGYGIEIWSVMNAIEFHCLGSKEAFSREWCTGYHEKVVASPRTLNEYLVREGLMMRRKAEDVSVYLPKVARHIQDVEHDNELYERLISAARASASAYDQSDKETRFKLSGEIERNARRAAGVAKAPFVADFIAALMKGGERPLVYAWHHDVHDILQERLKEYSPAVINGRSDKDANLKRYINGKTDLMMLSLRSAAGMDGLQHRATCCVFAELDWAPAVHSQAETRIARIGVDKTMGEIPSFYCVARTGYDEIMLDVLGLKTGQFVGLMGDEPEDLQEQKAAEQKAASRIRRLIDKLTGVEEKNAE
jgi:SNF2 family DNA or RNA helicase